MPTFNFNIIFDAFYGILVYLNHFFLNSITFDFGRFKLAQHGA